jgi:hypothetical protein
MQGADGREVVAFVGAERHTCGVGRCSARGGGDRERALWTFARVLGCRRTRVEAHAARASAVEVIHKADAAVRGAPMLLERGEIPRGVRAQRALEERGVVRVHRQRHVLCAAAWRRREITGGGRWRWCRDLVALEVPAECSSIGERFASFWTST